MDDPALAQTCWILEDGPAYGFRDWPNPEVPPVAAGVYTVWRGEELVYVGMSGRGRSSEDLARRRAAGAREHGLFTRLASHAAGRRSGDQFCVYVADRFVLPLLTPDEIRAVADGRLSLDAKVREFIHAHLAYRVVTVDDGAAARRVESLVRSGALRAGKPSLNPSR